PAVPGEVVAAAVAVLLAVRFVVLAVVGDEVGEGEPVVAGDEVDAARGGAEVVGEEVAGAGQAGGHLRDQPRVAAHEPAHQVAVAPVPLRPAHAGEGPDVVGAGGVPG